MPRAIWKGQVIAESDQTIVIEGNHYFPSESVAAKYLRPSTHLTTCPWKGVASYYDVVVDGDVNHAAAWYYPSPRAAAAQIAGYVAFWRGVKVVDDDGLPRRSLFARIRGKVVPDRSAA